MGAAPKFDAVPAFDTRTVATLMTRNPRTASPELSLEDLVNGIFLRHAVSFVPVVEDSILLGYVDAQIVRKIDREHWTTTKVEDVVESVNGSNTVFYDSSVTNLMQKVTRTGRRKFIVVDAHGLVGVISLSDLIAVLKVFDIR